MTTKFGLKKLETSFYRVLQNVCRYFEPLRQGLRVWRTDRQTDGRADGRAAVNNSAFYRPTLKMWADWLYQIESNQIESNRIWHLIESNIIVFFFGESPITNKQRRKYKQTQYSHCCSVVVAWESCDMKRSKSFKANKGNRDKKTRKKEKNMVNWRETVQSYLKRVSQRYRLNCVKDGSIASPQFLQQLASSIADDHVPAKVGRHTLLLQTVYIYLQWLLFVSRSKLLTLLRLEEY